LNIYNQVLKVKTIYCIHLKGYIR